MAAQGNPFRRHCAASETPLAVAQSFAELEVAPGDEERAGGLEIVIGDATIRVGGNVAPSFLVEAIRALRSA